MEEQFKLHIFGGAYALPTLLIIGLGTRFAALGLLLMTGVIQLVFPDGWADFHLYWAALAVSLGAIGPDASSITGSAWTALNLRRNISPGGGAMLDEGRRRLTLVASGGEVAGEVGKGAPREPKAAGSRDLDWTILMARAQDGDNVAYLRLLQEITPYLRLLMTQGPMGH